MGNIIEEKRNRTTMLFALAFVFIIGPAIAGFILYLHTFILCVGTGEWMYPPINFNAYHEWWFEFVLCVGGFLTGLVLWSIAAYRYANNR